MEVAQIWRELAPHYFPVDYFGSRSDLVGTGSTLFPDGLCLEAAQIWQELAPHYFPADCFGGGSDLAGTGSTLFFGGLFWRQLRFGGKWLHIIFQRIVLEAAQIWGELAPHYLPADCFGGSSDLAGSGPTLFSGGLFRRQFRFGGNWLHIIFQRIVLEAAQIWREMAPHYFSADCF